jgi:hypothetical protein
MRSAEFLLGLVDQDHDPFVSFENVHGEHAGAIRVWRGQGFLSSEPGLHPAPSCPHCHEGVPYRFMDRYVCSVCRSTVDSRRLQVWTLDRQAFFWALAQHLRLRGGVRKIDACLWQLGTGECDAMPIECFYRGRGSLSEQEQRKLNSYRRMKVFHGIATPENVGQMRNLVSLLKLFDVDGSFAQVDLTSLLRSRGAVRFESHSGALWLGDTWLGEVPPDSKEFYLLECLAEQLDHYVPYRELKREVLRRSGSVDETDEASFCHGLKRRIKKQGIAEIDRLLVTTNKADGYRLRGYLSEPCQN